VTDVCTMCGDSGVDRCGQSCDCEAWMPMPPQPVEVEHLDRPLQLPQGDGRPALPQQRSSRLGQAADLRGTDC